MTTLAEELDVIDLQRRQKLRAAQNVVDALEAFYRVRDYPSDLETSLCLSEAKVTWEYIAKHEGLVRSVPVAAE